MTAMTVKANGLDSADENGVLDIQCLFVPREREVLKIILTAGLDGGAVHREAMQHNEFMSRPLTLKCLQSSQVVVSSKQPLEMKRDLS